MTGDPNSRANAEAAELASTPEGDEAGSQRQRRDSAQSGMRVAPAFGARIDAALAASARTETTLADLFRTAKFLAATISTVRDANATLARELESLAQPLAAGGDERTVLAGRIQRLERILDVADQDAARERERLVSEHDKFIAMLVADHERDLESLRLRLAELEEGAESRRSPKD